MSTGTYVPVTCAGCKQPITADLLRLIVREEVGKLLAAHGVPGTSNDQGEKQ